MKNYRITVNGVAYDVTVEEMNGVAAPVAPVAPVAPAVVEADVADEIAQNIEALVGTAVETAPKPTPKHPTAHESTTSKFASLNLQFGRNYDTKK